MKTGGGPYKVGTMSDLDVAIVNMRDEQIHGISNTYYYDNDNCQTVIANCETGNEHDYSAHNQSEIVYDNININSTTNEYSGKLPDDVDCYETQNVLNETYLCEGNEENREPEEQIEMENEVLLENNWSTYSSNKLRQPTSSKLMVSKDIKTIGNMAKKRSILVEKKHITKKYVSRNEQLIQGKLKFVRLQKEKFLEEHSLKIELLRKKD
ncbi:hypothetical protein NQ317_004371 [Molorchus minor]|uniref:Uncharacterized protein n=1 Tax=Molorchus minor TaxID=1323400 RepID=A0ABQ9J4H3_9CUCU|nr:hypothetical protein NQ317_004371 [Molorchus minor]